MRVVLDTNVIASRYIVPQGKPAQILDRWSEGAFDLLLSAPILAEIRRVLRYPRLCKKHNLHDAEIDEIIEGLQELAIIVVSERPIRVVADDPDDDKLLECATAGGAEFLVTGDQHLLTLGSFRGIQILPPAVFLAYLDSQLAES